MPTITIPTLTDLELSALNRFCETCEDGEGYDVPKPMMQRLATIGVVGHSSRGIYFLTSFGQDIIDSITNPPPAHTQKPDEMPIAREVGRMDDMHQHGHLRIGFDNENDVYVAVWDGEKGASVEFCTCGSGGGNSPKTRQALINLMIAMEADNKETPHKDWWHLRMNKTHRATPNEVNP